MRRILSTGIALALLLSGFITWRTREDLRPLPATLSPGGSGFHKVQILDRRGVPLSVTYQNEWNVYNQLPLHEMPLLLQQAFIDSEDQRFYQHHGVDWPARFHAALQNLAALRTVRGASTITEQVVRMLHPRPRTVWSRWLEGIEAARLEDHFSKAEILEFYLNQVPYAHQRRGVAQAATLYFDRDLTTLTTKELLALVVLVRAPSGMDLLRETQRAQQAVNRLAASLLAKGKISNYQYQSVKDDAWAFSEFRLPVEAGHFVRHMYDAGMTDVPTGGTTIGSAKALTTLDSSLQSRVQHILDTRLKDLSEDNVSDGAVLVVNHQTDEVLAWVNGGGLSSTQSGGWIDAVTTARQPGSTLKPFLYALALEMGWTPATLINDSPLAEAVGTGLHRFDNYSRTCYGPLRLRDALGNSLNIPAVRTIQFAGIDHFLDVLKELGVKNLRETADYYGAGIALGNGEISLFELVQAYAVLARGGVFRPLRMLMHPPRPVTAARRVFSAEAAALIANILSDPQARRLEFGEGYLLRFPFQTAVKTGTSNDHRDAWTVGFSSQYAVGVWMGNLDRKPTSGVTGTSGPALVLRAVFAELNRYNEPEPLYLSPKLISVAVCRYSGLRATPRCPVMQEWFVPETIPEQYCNVRESHNQSAAERELVQTPIQTVALLQPTPNLQLAMDPRIPDEMEAFAFMIPKHLKPQKVEWIVDNEIAGVTAAKENQFLWPLSPGTHCARARIWRPGDVTPQETPQVNFQVK